MPYDILDTLEAVLVFCSNVWIDFYFNLLVEMVNRLVCWLLSRTDIPQRLSERLPIDARLGIIPVLQLWVDWGIWNLIRGLSERSSRPDTYRCKVILMHNHGPWQYALEVLGEDGLARAACPSDISRF